MQQVPISPADSSGGAAVSPLGLLRPDAAEHAVAKFYDDVRSYLESEMAMQEQEWEYLLAANQFMLARSRQLNERAAGVGAVMDEAEQHLVSLPQHFTKLDQLEHNLEALESVVEGLDQYSRILEERFAPTS